MTQYRIQRKSIKTKAQQLESQTQIHSGLWISKKSRFYSTRFHRPNFVTNYFQKKCSTVILCRRKIIIRIDCANLERVKINLNAICGAPREPIVDLTRSHKVWPYQKKTFLYGLVRRIGLPMKDFGKLCPLDRD